MDWFLYDNGLRHERVKLHDLFRIIYDTYEGYKSRSSPPEVFLGKGVLKICSKFTGEHPCQNAISIKLFCMPKGDFNKVALQLY